VAHSRGVAMLDDLVMGLVSSGSSQEGRDSNKSLHVDVVVVTLGIFYKELVFRTEPRVP